MHAPWRASPGAAQLQASKKWHSRGQQDRGAPGGLQMDLLEHAAMEDVVVLSVVLQEVKARNLAAYSRLRKLCAAPRRRACARPSLLRVRE